MMKDDVILLSHGAGARQSHDLIREVFAGRFGMPEHLTDSAILQNSGMALAFTTDSYVVDPVFFPGGDIGKLAVCGTVNDLAVSGAAPAFLSASFIIEEGLSIADLGRVASSMASEAEKAGVRIIAGDTKVVERGKCDSLFINTSGIGFIKGGRERLSDGSLIQPGDKIIVNGTLGNHEIAILGTRKKLDFRTPVTSDCASLNHIIAEILDRCNGVRFMRDLTRGGLATALNELFSMIRHGIRISEKNIPVDEAVAGICEMLGFHPAYLANEGKFLIVSDPEDEERILEIMQSNPLGIHSATIGEITPERHSCVIMETQIGGTRILDMPSGLQIPRIC